MPGRTTRLICGCPPATRAPLAQTNLLAACAGGRTDSRRTWSRLVLVFNIRRALDEPRSGRSATCPRAGRSRLSRDHCCQGRARTVAVARYGIRIWNTRQGDPSALGEGGGYQWQLGDETRCCCEGAWKAGGGANVVLGPSRVREHAHAPCRPAARRRGPRPRCVCTRVGVRVRAGHGRVHNVGSWYLRSRPERVRERKFEECRVNSPTVVVRSLRQLIRGDRARQTETSSDNGRAGGSPDCPREKLRSSYARLTAAPGLPAGRRSLTRCGACSDVRRPFRHSYIVRRLGTGGQGQVSERTCQRTRARG